MNIKRKGKLKRYFHITSLKTVPRVVSETWREETESQVQDLSLSDTSSSHIKLQPNFKEAIKNT